VATAGLWRVAAYVSVLVIRRRWWLVTVFGERAMAWWRNRHRHWLCLSAPANLKKDV